MITQYIQQRLASVPLLPDFRAVLDEAVANSEHDPRVHPLHRLPLDIFHALGGEDDRIIMPFVAAWSLLDYTVLRLDHLQDNDPEDIPLPTAPNSDASYSLVLALYIAANALLDDMDDQLVPDARWLRLRRLWNDCVLAGASGQYRDLLSANTSARGLDRLDEYQQLAHAKAGNLFALAFAAPAILVTDDESLITACRFAGEAFGALLQLGDDLRDQKDQLHHQGLTLPSAYAEAIQHLPQPQGADATLLWAYWQHVRDVYRTQVDSALRQAGSVRLESCVHQIFDTAFGSPQ